MASTTSSVLENLLTATDSILSTNNIDSATNSAPLTPTSQQPPQQWDKVDDGIPEHVPTIFLLEECFSTLYGSREKERRCVNGIEEEQQEHRNKFHDEGGKDENEVGGVQGKRTWQGELQNEKSIEECTTTKKDSKSYLDRLGIKHHDNRVDDICDSRRRGKTLPLTKYDKNFSNDVGYSNKGGDGLHSVECVGKLQEKEEERDLLLEAVQARMKRQKEKARKAHEALLHGSDEEVKPTLANNNQKYDFSKMKVSKGVHETAGEKMKNDGLDCTEPLLTHSKGCGYDDVISADAIASKCLQDFLVEVKQFQKQHGGGAVNEGTKEKFADLITERYLCGRLSQHLPLTPTVFKVRTVISSFVEKCSSGVDDPPQEQKKIPSKLEEKAQTKEQQITAPPTMKTSLLTKDRNIWKCNVCSRENHNPAINATCVTCGRTKGHKTKNKRVLPPPKDTPNTITLGDVTVKMQSEDEESVQFDYQRENDEKQKLEKARKTKEDFHLKQKLDYEMDSRKSLEDDINDVLSSIRSSIDI